MAGRRLPTLIALSACLPLVALLGAGQPRAQTYGAMAGHTYIPSSNDPGCGGVLCNPLPPADPARPTVPIPPPLCGGGLLCDVFPYNMGQPFPSSDSVAAEKARAAAATAAAAAAPQQEPPAAPAKRLRRHRKVRSTTAASRTPAPAAAAQ